MKYPLFKLEEYLSEREFKAKYLFCTSDAESLELSELLSYADEEVKYLWDTLRLNYTESPGHPLLREEIAKLYPGLNAENVLVFAGAEEGVYCGIKTLLNPQDHVIAFSPCYQSLQEVPKLAGAAVTVIALKEEEGWQIDVEKVKNALQTNTRMVVINTPHNPTGAVLSEEGLQELIQLLEPRGIYLFSDEAYRFLGPKETTWNYPVASKYVNGLSLGVMSKAFGLPGLRIGWIACQDVELLHDIQETKYYTSICSSAPSEILSIIALKAKDKLLTRNNTIARTNLAILDEFFEEQSGRFAWVRPQGGCVGFARHLGNKSMEEISVNLLKETGILIMPGTIFDVSADYFRFGFGRKNMPEVLEIFTRFFSHENTLSE